MTTSNEGNVGIYAENTVHWTDWLRTTAGWRGDYFAASVEFSAAAGELGKSQRGPWQPEIQNDGRAVR